MPRGPTFGANTDDGAWTPPYCRKVTIFTSLASNFGGKADARLFWIGLIIAPAMWIIFFLTALFGFRFQWMILVIIGLTMSMSNLLGYLRCRLGTTESVTNMANTYMQRQMFSNVMNMFKSKATGSGQPTPNDMI